MAAYTQTSFLSSITTLSVRLQDPSFQYWSSTELGLYIQDSLRTWQALTTFYRQRAVSVSSPSTPFYDLSTILPQPVFGYNLTDRDLISLILYQLLEPQLTGGFAYQGTDQFSLAQITQAIERRINRFMSATGCVVTRSIHTISAPPISRVDLPNNLIDIRRLGWLTSSDDRTWDEATDAWDDDTSTWDTSVVVGYPLSREDSFTISALTRSGSVPGNPKVYAQSVLPPASIQIHPPPAINGALDLCGTYSISGLAPSVNPTTIRIPDDLIWGVRFGVLADLLSTDGQDPDPARASYCEGRFQQAVQLAKLHPSILLPEIQGVGLNVESIHTVDNARPGWQRVSRRPKNMGMVGRNLFCLADTPDDTYGLSFDLVRNMPVPAADGDYLQISEEMLEPVLDYAMHLASFKMGGQEFQQTQTLYKNFIMAAAEQNSRIRQFSFFNDILRKPGMEQSAELTRLGTPDTRGALHDTTPK